MDGPGPASQANTAAAARAARATRRASGQAASRVAESQSAQVPPRGRGAEEDSAEEDEGEEDESSGDEDDEEEGGEEKPPIHHHEIREKLLRKASQGGQLKYVNGQPESGLDPLDITAPESSQVTWDMRDRQHWPDVLTLWDRPNPWNNPTYEIGVMKYKGRVVLDFNDKPIRNFRIPATICSKVEGLRMEAWLRSDNRLSFGDIEARVMTKSGAAGEIIPIFDKRVLSKRANIARERVGLISWVRKRGNEAKVNFMDDLRTQAQKDNNLATNKDLDKQQKAQLELLGVNKKKKSNAPTREDRIEGLKRRAAGTGSSVAGPSSAAAAAGPSDPVAATSDGEDDSTDDTDVEEALQATHIQAQAPEDDTDDEGSISSSLIDPADSRHDKPTNVQEVADLRRALEDTTGHFSFLTGQEPQPTNPGDNYFSQWAMLQEQFRTIWESRGNPDEAPRLNARDRWTGGISQYNLAETIREGMDDEESE